jgi:hypothetical protein
VVNTLTGRFRTRFGTSLFLKEIGITMRIFAIIILFMVSLAMPAISPGQTMGPHGMMGQGMYGGGPYGKYCPGMKWGPYGVRKPVKTVAKAKQVIETYLSGNRQGVHVGKIEEKELYFEAEILDRNGKFLDGQIVDKRTGRIRSIY